MFLSFKSSASICNYSYETFVDMLSFQLPDYMS